MDGALGNLAISTLLPALVALFSLLLTYRINTMSNNTMSMSPIMPASMPMIMIEVSEDDACVVVLLAADSDVELEVEEEVALPIELAVVIKTPVFDD